MGHYDDEETLHLTANNLVTPTRSVTPLEALQGLLAKTSCEVTLDGNSIQLYDNDREVGRVFDSVEAIERVLLAKLTWLQMLESAGVNA